MYRPPESWWTRNWSWVVVVGGCVGVFCVASGFIVVMLVVRVNQFPGQTAAMMTPPPIASNYYYDLNTQQLFVDDAELIPPIHTASGEYVAADGAGSGAGVKAYVFACGDCSDPTKRFIGYLEMYTPEAQQKMQQFMMQAQQPGASISPEAYLMYEEGQVSGRLIKRADDEQWVPAESDEGALIVNELTMKCPHDQGKDWRLRPCFP
jgi:hypothetical protein